MRKPTEDCHGFKKNQISPSTALLHPSSSPNVKTMIIKTKMVTKHIKKNKSSPAGVEIFEHLMGAEDLSRIKSSPDGAAGGRLDLSNPTANKSGAELFSY